MKILRTREPSVRRLRNVSQYLHETASIYNGVQLTATDA